MANPSAATTTGAPASLPNAPEPMCASHAGVNTQQNPAQLPRSPNNLAGVKPTVQTPVHVDRLSSLLSAHPDCAFSEYVIHGMSQGFAIGFRDTTNAISSLCLSSNHPSALRNKSFVSAYLQSSCESGETAGPFPTPPFSRMYVSGLGIVPKKSGKLRVIHDLSSPDGYSVNDGISREEFSPEYATLDTAISHIMALGPGCYLTKVDVRNAFRLCPVRPADWFLLGIQWENQYYYDRVLPFGLRSAPFIFNQFADGLQWILQYTCKLPYVLHYLDDFLDVAGPSKDQAQRHHDLILDMFNYLHVPVAPEKVEGPSTTLVFLGIELDTVCLEMRLPSDKKDDILATVLRILSTNRVTKRELASVVGKLSFASRAIPAGRTFLRRMYDFMKATATVKTHTSLLLPASAQDDMKWWSQALTMYPGKSFFLLDRWTPAPDMQLQTDASGTIGYGAFYCGKWLSAQWTPEHLPLSIEFKELYAIVVACHTWGQEWPRQRIMFQCDNEAVVQCIKSGTCRSKAVMSLIRSLYWVCIKYNFLVSATHVPGVTNTVADALSRGLLQKFKTLAPQANLEPDLPVSPHLD